MTAPEWTDHITIMQARGDKRLAKLHRADGTTAAYDEAWTYDAQVVPVAGLLDLFHLLQWLLPRPNRCVVRGEPVGELRGIRRLVHHCKKTDMPPTLQDVPRRWLAVDWDGLDRPANVSAHDLEACGDAALNTMPEVFRQAGCIIQASASHGIKDGLRLRGWFWCDRPMTTRELMRWLAGTPCDPSVWRPVQPIYTARPMFGPGRAEHLPQRIHMMAGSPEEPWLVCPSAEELADPPAKPPTEPMKVARGEQAEAYAYASLVSAANAIIGAKEGTRHDTIIAECRSLGRLVKAGLLPEKHLSEVVKKAAERAGKKDLAEVESCIEWGLANPSAAKLPEAHHVAA